MQVNHETLRLQSQSLGRRNNHVARLMVSCSFQLHVHVFWHAGVALTLSHVAIIDLLATAL